MVQWVLFKKFYLKKTITSYCSVDGLTLQKAMIEQRKKEYAAGLSFVMIS
jgi:hypothetical protein